MPTRRYFANAAPQRTLASSITSGALTLTVSGTFSGWPVQFPFFATIDIGTASAEIVSVTAIASSVATIVRNQGGTAATAHAAGATLDQTFVAQDADEANAHTSANTGVHGISGSVVGTSDVQTLTNKTLTNPSVNGAVLSGTLSGAPTFSGAVTASAAGTALAVTNNATVGGTLGVTGALTAGSLATGGGAAVTGAVTAASVSANSNGALTGVIVPRTYANEAAATAGIGAPVAGTVVYLTAPTTAGTSAGLFVYVAATWVPYKRPRVGGRVTTSAAQALSATTLTTLNNNGAAWTATEDSGGFVQTSTTAPLVVPAGLGALYVVGVKYVQSTISSGRAFVDILINGANAGRLVFSTDSNTFGSLETPLNAGDTIGAEAFTTTAANASIGIQLYCYRISD
jgi:hypothetical protein